jgi:tRNA G10  N-methylase Trm11
MHSLLKHALESAFTANSISGSRANSLVFNYAKFIGQFKQDWTYGGPVTHPLDYDKYHGSLLLLFHKNVAVTNIIAAEALSLLRINTHFISSADPPSANETAASISFFSDDEYTKFLDALFESVLKNYLSPDGEILEAQRDDFISFICNNYGSTIERTIVVNFYFTSALVHIPPSMRTNLRRSIAESGYIHSGGAVIYARKADKAKTTELKKNLTKFLDGYSEKRAFLIPYADEFFSQYDLGSVASLRQGLDGVKLKLRKHYIEGIPLIEFLETLPASLPVHVPLGIKHYDKERSDAKDTEQRSTIWIIADHSIAEISLQDRTSNVTDNARVTRSRDALFLLVYEQAFINDNQFVTFKERKPGWYASITLPHTLSIAMANVARRPRDSALTNKLVVLDPFFGTGTTLFDAALRFPNAVIVGLDRDPMAPLAALDNAHFFSLQSNEITKLKELVHAGAALLQTEPDFESLHSRILNESYGGNSDSPSNTSAFAWAFEAAYQRLLQSKRETGGTLSDSIKRTELRPDIDISAFNGSESHFPRRLAYYLIWRAISLGTFSIRDSAANLVQVILKELLRTEKELEHLKQRIDRKEIGRIGDFCETKGLYSNSLLVSRSSMETIRSSIRRLTLDEVKKKGKLSNWDPGIWLVHVDDSIEALSLPEFGQQVDIVLTDPPYGFNTREHGDLELMSTFGKLANRLSGTLSESGQLVMVLPAFAKNGRQIPFYETSGAICRQLFAANRGFVSNVEKFPSPKQLFAKPYYWVSATVLERRIVHFSLDN